MPAEYVHDFADPAVGQFRLAESLVQQARFADYDGRYAAESQEANVTVAPDQPVYCQVGIVSYFQKGAEHWQPARTRRQLSR